jgi:hypothetical protein
LPAMLRHLLERLRSLFLQLPASHLVWAAYQCIGHRNEKHSANSGGVPEVGVCTGQAIAAKCLGFQIARVGIGLTKPVLFGVHSGVLPCNFRVPRGSVGSVPASQGNILRPRECNRLPAKRSTSRHQRRAEASPTGLSGPDSS